MLPGRTPLLTFEMQLRSRYSETDKMGVVYHSRYLEYFEIIRTEFVREAGLSYAEMENSGVMLPVTRIEIAYKQPILYDELMSGKMMLYDLPGVRLTTYYDIRPLHTQHPAVLGKVELVFVDVESRKPVRAPLIFMEKIQNYAKMA